MHKTNYEKMGLNRDKLPKLKSRLTYSDVRLPYDSFKLKFRPDPGDGFDWNTFKDITLSWEYIW